MIRTTKILSCAFLVALAVNGHVSSLAAATHSLEERQPADVRSDGGQPSLLATLVTLVMPGDAPPGQQDGQKTSSAQQVASSDDPALVSAITPMTSITIDVPPQSQPEEAEAAAAKEKEKADADIEQEKARLELLLQQLTAKEKELSLLREKTTAAATQLNAEKTRAEALEAQLNQKEQELSGICTQRDTHQQMSQELNRTKSSLELARQQVADIDRQFSISNDQLDVAMQRIADLDLQLVAKDQELKTELASRDSQLVQAKRILASVGKSLPKPAKITPSMKNAFPQQAVARLSPGLTKVNEQLTAALKEELKRGTVVMEQRGDKLTLALASGELFGVGRVTMTTAGASLVKRIGVALRKFRPESIEVAGHTDSIPVKYNPKRPFKDNAELSQFRAENASRALIKGGLGADRVRAIGYADSKPVATNDTEEGRTKNRRVEIIVTQSGPPIASSDEQPSGTRAAAPLGAVVQKVATR
ncbi:putative Outer membrane protein, OmpA/MotB family [Candidatus Nitrospira nitrosa]|uniref:Putative Outer membrane protein, OmpA/MotB family n=1 Tax=Candidatus Nitrospira nitrosa TaxID=1742972 RepID=A0A0S4LAL0_9BACT|nr:OmpA family protein [Candidatus Nitrospira nitrosa]CUS33817.1 putative Outer membrane protein, OmpA/MotB family [Candidatus Nitrospira nitrosa]